MERPRENYFDGDSDGNGSDDDTMDDSAGDVTIVPLEESDDSEVLSSSSREFFLEECLELGIKALPNIIAQSSTMARKGGNLAHVQLVYALFAEFGVQHLNNLAQERLTRFAQERVKRFVQERLAQDRLAQEQRTQEVRIDGVLFYCYFFQCSPIVLCVNNQFTSR
jgi:hypothetical protein